MINFFKKKKKKVYCKDCNLCTWHEHEPICIREESAWRLSPYDGEPQLKDGEPQLHINNDTIHLKDSSKTLNANKNFDCKYFIKKYAKNY